MATSSDKQSFNLSRQRIGAVYARALLDAATDAGTTADVLTDFESLLSDVIAPRNDLREALTGSMLKEEERISVLDKAFAGQMTPVLLTFLKVVTRHGRQDALAEIYAALVKLHHQRIGLVEVTAISAAEMPGDVIDSLTAKLQDRLGRSVALENRVDPELIGGLVVRIGDTVIDGSVANRLKQIRRQAQETMAKTAKDSLERFTNNQ